MRISINGGEWKGASIGVATGDIQPETLERLLDRLGRIVDRFAAALEAAAKIAQADPVDVLAQGPDDDESASINH